MISRRHVLTTALGFAAAAAARPATAAGADDWPKRPLTVITAFDAGGNDDLLTRLDAKYLEPILGVPIKVVNTPGGGGIPAVMSFLKAPADGYTFLRFSAQISVIGPLVRKAPYDTLRDLMPLWLNSSNKTTLYVSPDSPYKTFDDFIAAAKKKEMIVGINTIGSPQHLAAANLELQFGVKFKILAQKTMPASITGLMGGQSDAVVAQTTHYRLFHDDLRPLAVLSPRLPFFETDLPGVPTLPELHPDKPADDWIRAGWALKAGTDPAIATKVIEAARKAMANPDYQKEVSNFVTFYPTFGVAETRADLKRAIDYHRSLLKSLGMLAE
jgi:tripartite-type tricarboxylate transporter receptor subunit TctC